MEHTSSSVFLNHIKIKLIKIIKFEKFINLLVICQVTQASFLTSHPLPRNLNSVVAVYQVWMIRVKINSFPTHWEITPEMTRMRNKASQTLFLWRAAVTCNHTPPHVTDPQPQWEAEQGCRKTTGGDTLAGSAELKEITILYSRQRTKEGQSLRCLIWNQKNWLYTRGRESPFPRLCLAPWKNKRTVAERGNRYAWCSCKKLLERQRGRDSLRPGPTFDLSGWGRANANVTCCFRTSLIIKNTGLALANMRFLWKPDSWIIHLISGWVIIFLKKWISAEYI